MTHEGTIMTTKHQPIRDLVDQHRDQEETPSPYELYEELADTARSYLYDATELADPASDARLSLAVAQAYATLALAAATVHTKSCGVHCHAIGC